MYKKIIIGTILIFFLIDDSAFANELYKIADYLNNIKTLRASFLQKDNNGQSSGVLYVKKPGKMRVMYKNPSQYLIVANGSMISYVDLSQKHVTYLPINTSPAQFLLQKSINFSKNVEVQNIFRFHKLLHVVIYFKYAGTGLIDLQFIEKPLKLNSWIVIMPNNQKVYIKLLNLQINQPISDDIFQFKGSWQANPHDSKSGE